MIVGNGALYGCCSGFSAMPTTAIRCLKCWSTRRRLPAGARFIARTRLRRDRPVSFHELFPDRVADGGGPTARCRWKWTASGSVASGKSPLWKPRTTCACSPRMTARRALRRNLEIPLPAVAAPWVARKAPEVARKAPEVARSPGGALHESARQRNATASPKPWTIRLPLVHP